MKEKEKAIEDAVRKKLTNLMQQNVLKRTKILDDDNHLVTLVIIAVFFPKASLLHV